MGCVRENEVLQAKSSMGEVSGFWHLLLVDREIMWFQFLTQEGLCSPSLRAGVWTRALRGRVLLWWRPGAGGCIGCLCLAWL